MSEMPLQMNSPRRASQMPLQSPINLNEGTLPPKPGAAKPAAAGGKKVTKETAIGRAFKSEMIDGIVNLSARNVGDQ